MEISRPLDIFRKLVKPAKKSTLSKKSTPPPPPKPGWADPFKDFPPSYTDYKPKTICAQYKLWKKCKKIAKSLPKSHPETGKTLSWKIKFGYYKGSKILRIVEIESMPRHTLDNGAIYHYHWRGIPKQKFFSSYGSCVTFRPPRIDFLSFARGEKIDFPVC